VCVCVCVCDVALTRVWVMCSQLPNFLVEFITPIIKATKGNQRLVFHTMPECVPAAARMRLPCIPN